MRTGEYFDGSAASNTNTISANAAPAPLQQTDESRAMAGLGFGKPLIERFAKRADANGTCIEAELLVDGTIREQAYFAAMARYLRLPFIDRIGACAVADSDTLDVQLLRPNQIRLQHARHSPQVAIAPEAARLADLAALLDRLPALRQGLVIAAPSQIRAAVWQAGAARRVRATVAHLFETHRHSSARIVLSGTQGFMAGCIVVLLAMALLIGQNTTLIYLHLTLSLLYLSSLAIRIAALAHDKRILRPPLVPARTDNLVGRQPDLPVYTVMVALYREAAVAEQLVRSLERLDWPASLLDIKLVCEGDDEETIAALNALSLRPHFEIVSVPPCQPRTKPKALTYALSGARGQYLVIYDAEDRPHPQQLREAHARFCRDGGDLACLQAPLVITNARASFLSALFAVEYAALFRAMLPMLAAYRLPMPLGGTSNHFRTSALIAVGGWDPFNMTEDADLGVRLYRHGYRSATLFRHTLEDAPTTAAEWLNQRTRWYKGWVQTWLVATRHPRTHIAEMGGMGALVFHLMVGGMLVSALLHPLLLLSVLQGIIAISGDAAAAKAFITQPLFALDLLNILGSYGLFVLLGFRSMTGLEKRLVGWRCVAVPLYWMMTSLAAWRAVNELRIKPFFWNKTPHRPVDAPIGTAK
ncbi:glycosyltransferase [Neorhizobium sp. NPDC001467]|uniref:glycosyltransferase n=1 Tax=Neorhizobium sp. NPDC001467 TaxID=3390595 RepID=UPI003D028814